MQHDDPTINTISKTLEAQEKTQYIKHSPSMKMGTKPDARSRRNEIGRGDRTRPYKDRTRPISCSATAGISSSDRPLSEEVIGRTNFTIHHRGNNSVRIGRSSCDRTLSEVVTGRIDDTILRHGNVFSVTGRSGTGQPDAQSTTSDRVQRGSRAAPA